MRAIACCLFGDEPRYCFGATRLAKDAKSIYPGWAVRMYVGASVPEATVEQLLREGCDVINVDLPEDRSAALWRFSAVSDPKLDTVIVRDVDSRITMREAQAVADWLASGRQFHIMRDHPGHAVEMMAGMWGVHPDAPVRRLFKRVLDVRTPSFTADQEWLRNFVYPMARHDALIHDSIYSVENARRRFPDARVGYEFVGEPMQADGSPYPELREVLRQWEREPWRAALYSLRWRAAIARRDLQSRW